MVAVPELPERPGAVRPCLADAELLRGGVLHPRGLRAGGQYAANASRETSAQCSPERGRVPARPRDGGRLRAVPSDVDLARVTQLINKTNQFNPTRRRYSAAEVARRSRLGADSLTLQFRLAGSIRRQWPRERDDSPRPTSQDAVDLDIDTWVMSCRVFGRQLEDEAMNIAVEAARAAGAHAAVARDFLPTPKNARRQRVCIRRSASSEHRATAQRARTRWLLHLSDYVTRETHIAAEVGLIMTDQDVLAALHSDSPRSPAGRFHRPDDGQRGGTRCRTGIRSPTSASSWRSKPSSA